VAPVLQRLERVAGVARGSGTERGTESLVATLMLIHQRADPLVILLLRIHFHASVIVQREQHSSARLRTTFRDALQPGCRNQIQQRRCGHELTVRQRQRVNVIAQIQLHRRDFTIETIAAQIGRLLRQQSRVVVHRIPGLFAAK
jgi:hypothetical protein